MQLKMNNLKNILEQFQNKKITVIGDVMLDKYLEGDVSRINPEAPVPIVELQNEFFELGGAANVAANVATLGGKVSLFGFVGKDYSADIIRNLLRQKNISDFLDFCKTTTEKTRIIGKGQQLIRFDKEDSTDKLFSSEMNKKLLEEIQSSDIILISDYAKGTINSSLMESLSSFKNKMIVDPKPKNKNLYKGVFLVTPNLKECFEMSSHGDVQSAGIALKELFESNILITQGQDGMALFSEKNLDIPTFAKDVFDVVGAGDSVIAALALSIAAGATLEESAIIANHSAGVAVEKKGTHAVTIDELKEKIFQDENRN